MTRATIAGGVCVMALVFGAFTAFCRARHRNGDPAPAASPASTSSAAAAEEEAQPGFLYGRITTRGNVYEGRMRWGGGQEAFWGDYFNGAKRDTPWVAHAPRQRQPITIFGVELGSRERPIEVPRLFMARFGDIARLEARGREVRVTLKSGTVFDLDRLEASDFDDGVRVWDRTRGVVDLDSLEIRAIELLPTVPLRGAPDRLHGTVRTRHGDFTGFVQWDRQKCVGSDALDGQAAGGEISLRFDTIRSIARRSSDSALVSLLDGREIVLSGTRDVGEDTRGIYVDDRRYGRVLVSWTAFERVDFSGGGSGPAYGDFPPGRALTGGVTTRGGRRLAGRLVYDLDEGETTETLDAPSQGVDYTIPFGLISSIALTGGEERGAQPARVTLHGGEELQLERAGDLRQGNAGLLVFADGRPGPEYVPWSDVARVDLDRPPAMYPPPGQR